MARLFVGNFDFEHQLADASPRHQSASNVSADGILRLPEVSAGLEWSWLALAEPDDMIWTNAPPDPAFVDEISRDWGHLPRFVMNPREIIDPRPQVVPWGWSSTLVDWSNANEFGVDAPPLDIVRRVNSRLFRHQLENELGICPQDSRTIESIDDAVAAAENLPPDAPWVIKAGLGMSGRERFLGRGHKMSPQLPGWLQRRLKSTGTAVFEPWLNRLEEIGIQLEVPKKGSVSLLGLTPLLVDSNGQFRGSRLQPDPEQDELWKPATDSALTTAERLQSLGYFGPLGIDAMSYRAADGSIRIRPLQDLNGRFTMGRLALGLRNRLLSGECATWWHERAELCPQMEVLQQMTLRFPGLRFQFVGPRKLQRSRVTFLVIAPNLKTLTEVEAELAQRCTPRVQPSTSPDAETRNL